MKVKSLQRWNHGLARTDVLVAVLLMFLLFMLLIALILPVREAAHRNDEGMNCLMNLKQISMAQRIWEGDNGGAGRPEWPLVKDTIIARATFPVAVSMRDFDESSTRLVEQGIRFGTAFDGARLLTARAFGNQVSCEI